MKTAAQIAAIQDAIRLTDGLRAAVAGGATLAEAGAAHSLSAATVLRWLRRRDMHDAGDEEALLRGKSTGRTPLVTPTPREAAALQSLVLRTNRAEGAGSITTAARMFARSPDCSQELAAAILKRRASKHTLTSVIRRTAAVAKEIILRDRQPREQELGGMYCPGGLRLNQDAQRRLLAGERQSWDDASINFIACVPWQWGGDPCSDKFGVRVGRFQLLTCIDDASCFFPGFFLCHAAAGQLPRGRRGGRHVPRVARNLPAGRLRA